MSSGDPGDGPGATGVGKRLDADLTVGPPDRFSGRAGRGSPGFRVVKNVSPPLAILLGSIAAVPGIRLVMGRVFLVLARCAIPIDEGIFPPARNADIQDLSGSFSSVICYTSRDELLISRSGIQYINGIRF